MTRHGLRGRTVGTGLVWLVLGATLGGCGLGDDVPRMPGPAITTWVPVASAEPSPVQTGNLSPDGFASAERMAVRIRNVGCDTLTMSVGSGFAIDAHTVVTNRHVVSGSALLQVSTYDGRDVEVSGASTASLADLAVLRTDQELPSHPELAGADPQVGDPVTVVGYPEGGQLTVTTGKVIAATTDPLHQSLGEVLVTDAPVEPGSSGSAVLSTDGQVIGVVYAKNASDQSYIVPVSTLRDQLSDAAFTPVPSCPTPTASTTPAPSTPPTDQPATPQETATPSRPGTSGSGG
ncbi:serine protease [Isoptericola sp. b490]|uniref:S1C family serine protease n=1 Tax=Actinotalea lenta TaxID=3064654 RepID=UPI002712AF8F|nr:serine protease [Isoptericola sp. b490]MDO8120890.1 serine protease [Isoptericola sp. b490]